jgi:hypothetical protein
VHAAVRVASDQRNELERLCRYMTRAAIAGERLSRNSKGQVVLQLKSPYRDGTTHIVMQPQEFMQRLAGLVPRPRLHLIRFHGLLAPLAKLRAAVVPGTAKKPSERACEHARRPARMRWLAFSSVCSTSMLSIAHWGEIGRYEAQDSREDRGA